MLNWYIFYTKVSHYQTQGEKLALAVFLFLAKDNLNFSFRKYKN